MNTRIAIATVVGCVAALPILGLGAEYVGSAATLQKGKPPKPPTTEIATLSKLPSPGSNAEAHGVNEAGTVIVGHSFESAREVNLHCLSSSGQSTGRSRLLLRVSSRETLFLQLVHAGRGSYTCL